VLVRDGAVLGRGWHHQAGQPHAEIEALADARGRGRDPRGATLYVTLEPCCTQGRTPPCTAAIISAGIRRVVVGATDPNPRHAGRGFALLAEGGVAVEAGVLASECAELNAAFNHWIVRRTPYVIVKAAMTLDGKIATAAGESKWITGEKARSWAMRLRQGADAILVGVNTILADDPSLTVRLPASRPAPPPRLRRIVLDARARTPLTARLVADAHAGLTTVVVSALAPAKRVRALADRVRVIMAPLQVNPDAHPHPAPSPAPPSLNLNPNPNPNPPQIPPTPVRRATRHPPLDLRWLLERLGAEEVTSLLVEGGGEVNGSFLLGGLAQEVAFFYAPKILGGADSLRAVAGAGAGSLQETLALREVRWRRVGEDWLLRAKLQGAHG
jgi:diaminohydroxyphosphoribosylaminopyrimidine deaminase/5-amino-6-(5-phosphoribosylamino)uracil reductase